MTKEEKNKKRMKTFYEMGKELLYTILTAAIIQLTWEAYEIKRFGEATADPFDTIVAIVLTFAIMYGIRQKNKSEKLLKTINRQNKTIKEQRDAVVKATKIINQMIEKEEKRKNANQQ